MTTPAIPPALFNRILMAHRRSKALRLTPEEVHAVAEELMHWTMENALRKRGEGE